MRARGTWCRDHVETCPPIWYFWIVIAWSAVFCLLWAWNLILAVLILHAHETADGISVLGSMKESISNSMRGSRTLSTSDAYVSPTKVGRVGYLTSTQPEDSLRV